MDPLTVVAIALLILAAVVFISSFLIASKVNEIHKEVKTANGITVAVLADRAEGRRILEQVAPADRTTSEQGYVDELERGGRNIGHEDDKNGA